MTDDSLENRFSILVDSAKYDVSCASSGSSRANKAGSLGNARSFGICHSWAEDGRCISLLKLLQTNRCIYECAYCINRATSDIARASLSPEEIADLTMNFYRRNYIEGLFLSSAVHRSPDYSTEQMIRTLELLRVKNRFNGYIHVKGIPGADGRLVRKLCTLADRMSFNIELPSAGSLAKLAPQKNKHMLVGAMRELAGELDERRKPRRLSNISSRASSFSLPSSYSSIEKSSRTSMFLPAGQSTQMIVGASADTDKTIITLSEALYRRVAMRRVYYSAYIPVGDKRILPETAPPLAREHRLYQADWLIRFYGFSAGELLSDENPNFDLRFDPKSFWALNNLQYFPVDINHAPIDTLLRVPGIGPTSAQRIVAARKFTKLDFDDLKRIGVVLKRAGYFIVCKGKFFSEKDPDPRLIEQRLLENENHRPKDDHGEQLTLFGPDDYAVSESFLPLITGDCAGDRQAFHA